MEYGTGHWNAKTLGNHRAVLRVSRAAKAVRVRIPWRRRDAHPDRKNILVFSQADGQRVTNLVRVSVTRETGDLIFQADTPGDYFVYYLPWRHAPVAKMGVWLAFPHIEYASPETTADADWSADAVARADSLPQAQPIAIQAITEFDSFYPMEVIATRAETDALLAAHPGEAYLVFPEDRRFPIRMPDDLPQRWIERGPRLLFEGEAYRNEFYAFQIGVYAARQEVASLGLEFRDARGPGAGVIPAAAFRCVNLGGFDWLGRRFEKALSVPKGRIQPLWCGVKVPPDARAGVYEASAVLTSANAPARELRILLNVSDTLLDDGGEGDLWRQARLEWLDSRIGVDDDVVEPYVPVQLTGQTVRVLGRELRFGGDGLPESMISRFSPSVDRIDNPPVELLARPIRFTVRTDAGPVEFRGDGPRVVLQAPGAVAWEVLSQADGWSLSCQARMECDGHVDYRLTLKAHREQHVRDVGLDVHLTPGASRYLMGMGHRGGARPPALEWAWDEKANNNWFWAGDVNAGLQCRLKHAQPDWPIMHLKRTGIYRDWSNGGRGGARMGEEPDGSFGVHAFTGERTVAAGEELHFNFSLLITPVKTLDRRHWQWRIVHRSDYHRSAEEEAATGAKIVTVHQGNSLNPFINYPFLTVGKMKDYADAVHARGMRLKIYYTLRELSNRTAELWLLRSLGDEVFTDGAGFADPERLARQELYRNHTGDAWFCEHLVAGYRAAWHQPLGDDNAIPADVSIDSPKWNGRSDGALETVGLSRWHNYYLEGLRFLLARAGIDGLYLDGIGYDREVMKRVRKVLQRTRPGSLVDFHGGNEFFPDFGMCGTAGRNMEHFPYLDSLWFGEGFDYDAVGPDYWLVEISGIPGGLFGEMLGAGNPWRGMLYGMACRLTWCQGDPRSVWKAWDDFGIDQADMIGYWDPSCPVRTGRDDVLATVYRRADRSLIALASWAPAPTDVHLAIDWTALGLDPARTTLRADAIPGFQEAALFGPGDPIPVPPGKGWLLLAASTPSP